MENYQLKELFDRYVDNRCSAAEVEILIQHFNVEGSEFLSELIYQQLSALDDELRDPHLTFLADNAYKVIGAKINEGKSGQAKTLGLLPRIAVAAAVAVVIFGAGLFYFTSDNQVDPVKTATVGNDISPGKNGATIVLAGGKVIELSDAKTGVVIGKDLKYSDGTALSGLQPHLSGGKGDSEMLIARTSKGQTYQFTLADGTRVWLNADSRIRFPAQFSGKERVISLEGEGFFEVVHNTRQPFRVKSVAADGSEQVVEDIGTAFNISSYANEASVRTTLVEGEASVNAVVLKPGQQSVLKAAGIYLRQVDVSEAIAWKNGYFQFNAETLESVMNKLSRWYEVEVRYEGAAVKGIKFSGTMSRYEHIGQVLKKIAGVSNVQYSIKGKTVTLR